MTVDVHYFGMISDRLECTTERHTFDTSQSEINLRDYFESLFPVLKEMSYKIAVNQELTETLSTKDTIKEIALLPPFAGG
jgi:molybdopterin converting factor small subunit